MIDRLMICGELCRAVRVKRINPNRTSLSKREMIAVWRHVIALNTKADQQAAEIAVLKSGNVSHVQA